MGQFCSHSCDNSGPEDRVLAPTTALFAVLWWATRTRPERHTSVTTCADPSSDNAC